MARVRETVLARIERPWPVAAMAADLLASGDLAIAEIASRCGFASPFWFSRAFRAAHDRSPRAWRSALRGR